MTNKEVIETLRYIKFYKADKDSTEPHALDLAIKALEEVRDHNAPTVEISTDKLVEEIIEEFES